MPQTAHLALPYPGGSDDPNIPEDIQALADRIAATVQLYGTIAARPAASAALNGAVYITTDAPVRFFQCRGGAWVQFGVYDADFDALIAAVTNVGGVVNRMNLIGADPILELQDTDQPANSKKIWFMTFNGNALLSVRNDNESYKADALKVSLTDGRVDFDLIPTVLGADRLVRAMSGTYAARPAASAALNGAEYYCTDKTWIFRCIAGAWVWIGGGFFTDATDYQSASHGSWTVIGGTGQVDTGMAQIDVVVPAGESWLVDVHWGIGLRTDNAGLYYFNGQLVLSGALAEAPAFHNGTNPPDANVIVHRDNDTGDQGAGGATHQTKHLARVLPAGTTTFKVYTHKGASGTTPGNFFRDPHCEVIPRRRIPV